MSLVLLLLLVERPFTAATQQGLWWNMSEAVENEGLSHDESVTAFTAQGLFHKLQLERQQLLDASKDEGLVISHNQTTLMLFDIGAQNYDCELSDLRLPMHTLCIATPAPPSNI